MKAATIRGSRVASLVEQRPATAFFVLTLTISWSLWIPVLATVPSATELYIIPGGFGPALAAVTLVWLRGESVRAWLRDGLTPYVGKQWYVVALGLPIVLGASLGAILVGITGRFEVAQLTQYAPMYPIAVLFTMLVGGGQEEFGWRGFALPALQDHFDALTASLVIGVVWAVWHLPLFVFGVQGYGGRSFPLYAVLVIGFSIIFTWLYNNTGGSILLAMVLHGGINSASSLGGMFVGASAGESPPIFVAYGVPVWIVAAVLLLWFGRTTLSRGTAVTLFSTRRTDESAR